MGALLIGRFRGTTALPDRWFTHSRHCCGLCGLGGKERLRLRSFGKRFRRKRNPETYPAFPIHYVHRGSCPTVYRVQCYPDIIISELAPYFDVVGIEIEMLQEDGVDVAADGGVTVSEDAGDAFELRPYAVLRC